MSENCLFPSTVFTYKTRGSLFWLYQHVSTCWTSWTSRILQIFPTLMKSVTKPNKTSDLLPHFLREYLITSLAITIICGVADLLHKYLIPLEDVPINILFSLFNRWIALISEPRQEESSYFLFLTRWTRGFNSTLPFRRYLINSARFLFLEDLFFCLSLFEASKSSPLFLLSIWVKVCCCFSIPIYEKGLYTPPNTIRNTLVAVSHHCAIIFLLLRVNFRTSGARALNLLLRVK